MKKIIAAAVAAAIIAPVTAMASGPVLYGKLHMELSYIDNGGAPGLEYSSANLASNSSRIGVKGSEDLGNGLKAGYLIEWSVGMDGGSDLGQRNRAVTLSGGFGTALFGRWDTPMKSLGRKVDLFGERYGDTRQLTRSNALIDNRLNNVIAYVTPNMGGFNATLAYVLDVTSATADDTAQDAFSANAIYKNGPILVGAGYTKVMANVIGTDETDWRLAGSFKMGAFKVVGMYTDINDGTGTVGNDYDVWQLGGAFGFGSNTVKLQYSDKSEGVNNSDDGANVWALGFEHKMSKRTMVYADYGKLSNDSGSNIAFMAKIGNGSNTPAGGAGSNADGFGIGIIHKF
ncbi:MAG: porin [Pseudomonadota bacterium]